MGFREDTQKLADKFGEGGAGGDALPDRDDLDDEKPVVVVVNDGDLTESEAKKIEERLGTTEGSKREDEEEDKGLHQGSQRSIQVSVWKSKIE